MTGESHHSRGIREQGYARRFTAAVEFPIKDPLRFLAAAVIARWVEDRRKGMSDEIGEEWAEMAEVPVAWLEGAVA